MDLIVVIGMAQLNKREQVVIELDRVDRKEVKYELSACV